MSRSFEQAAEEIRRASPGASPDAVAVAAVLALGLESLTAAVKCVAMGDSVPAGLEAVAIAIAGPGLQTSLAGSIRSAVSALAEHADSEGGSDAQE